MDIETMHTVYLVASTGSFSVTAEMIPCSQPTISRRIKIAEDELGVTIFTRHSNHQPVTLTTEGKQIVEKFAQIIQEYNELLQLFKTQNKGVSPKSVTLGIAENTMITSIGTDALNSDFLSMYPNADFSITEDTEDNLFGLMTIGKIDYAIFTRYLWHNTSPFIHYYMNDKLRVSNFANYELYIATSEKSEIAGRDGITMKELADIPFLYSENVHNPTNSAFPSNHFVFFEACRLAGFTTKTITLDRPSRAVRTQAVVSGLGSTYCGLPDRLRSYSGTSHIRISDCPFHAEFFLVSEKRANEKEFIEVENWLKSYFTKTE